MAKSFDEYPLNFLYSYEMWLLTNSISSQCEKIFEAASVPSSGYSLGSNPEIHSIINNIVSESARVKKLISIPKCKTKNESGKQFEIHVGRAKYLQDILKGIRMEEILSARVRNTLEHFDEYLDEANMLASEGKLDKYVGIVIDTIMSHREMISPTPFPLRVYISSEKIFINMNYSIDLGKIYNESSEISKRFKGVLGGEDGINRLMWVRL